MCGLWERMVSLCQNCGKPIATKWIKAIWYHLETGREQCNHDDLYDIRIAEPRPSADLPDLRSATD